MKYVALIAILIGAPSSAEVVSASSSGFEVRESVPLVVAPDVVWSSFANISEWWDPEHTYSGKSENLSLSLQPGGCFCERFPKGGGIEHMRVAYIEPGKHVVLTGALGPLLYEATIGVMDVQVKPVAGGAQLTLDYKVAGFANGGANKLAAAVDGVLAQQMTRLRTYAAGRPRT
jgi:hypothetical protein